MPSDIPFNGGPKRKVVIEAVVLADTELEAHDYAEAYGEFIFSGDEVVEITFHVEPQDGNDKTIAIANDLIARIRDEDV